MPPPQPSGPDADRARPTVTLVDPLTWSREFSYDVEAEILGAAGVDLIVPRDEAERDTLIRTADAVISSGTLRVGPELIDQMANCIAIQCYSVGMDAVDAAAATARGIRVANVNASTADVADHTMTLILALQRRLNEMMAATHEHQWNLRELPEAWEIRRLEGQTLGIVGAGRIGRLVARRAQAFDFVTIAADPYPPDPPVEGLEIVSLEELFERSDVVAVCASLLAGSRGAISHELFSKAKPGLLFVNTARGGLVDEAALLDALDSGQVRLAALDVRDPEPPTADDPLTGRADVIQTPHMAAMSERTRSDVHHLVAENILEMLQAADRLDSKEAS